MFTKKATETDEGTELSTDENFPIQNNYTQWDLLTFFMLIVAVEHGLLLLKLGVSYLIDDVPQ